MVEKLPREGEKACGNNNLKFTIDMWEPTYKDLPKTDSVSNIATTTT